MERLESLGCSSDGMGSKLDKILANQEVMAQQLDAIIQMVNMTLERWDQIEKEAEARRMSKEDRLKYLLGDLVENYDIDNV